MRFSNTLKKFLLLAGSAFTVSLLSITNANAAESSSVSPDYLAVIAKNTTDILAKVNSLPEYIEQGTAYILNWQKSDDSQSTADMQANFDAIGKALSLNLTTQNTMQQQIVADMLGVSVIDLTTPKESPAVLKSVPQVNNLAYGTVLGTPPALKGTASAYEYLKNAAGLSFKHEAPQPAWGGSQDAQTKYKSFFNTVNAIESYDAYLLSGAVAEAQNGNSLTTAQNNLLNQATTSSWFAQVASEELGKVLRQILMFQSQTYVLLTQLLQAQKQQLAATAMTNTLLIANAQLVEMQLNGRAKGVMTQ